MCVARQYSRRQYSNLVSGLSAVLKKLLKPGSAEPPLTRQQLSDLLEKGKSEAWQNVGTNEQRTAATNGKASPKVHSVLSEALSSAFPGVATVAQQRLDSSPNVWCVLGVVEARGRG